MLDLATQFHGESLAEGLRRWHAKAAGSADGRLAAGLPPGEFVRCALPGHDVR